MSLPKFDLEKFNGENDFNLWRLKMRAILVHQGLEDALEGEDKMPDTLTESMKREILRKAHSEIVLSLSNQVLREVSKEKTAAGI